MVRKFLAKLFTSKEAYNKYMRKAKWKSRGITDLGLAEEVYEKRTVCEICGSSLRLQLDHCHETNKIRGMLCGNCNIGLGIFKDKVDVLRKAVDYLDFHGKEVYN